MQRSNKLATVLAVAVAWTATAAPTPPRTEQGWLGLVQTASLRLRLKRLDVGEEHALAARQARGESPRHIYEQQIRSWLDREFFARLALGMMPVPKSSSLLIDTLRRFRDDDGAWVYYLPHATPPVQSGRPPCKRSDRAMVTPWWAKDQRVAICTASYAPDHAFDAVGYCGGQPEPVRPIEPRAGCGCGPLLLACLPPQDEAPRLKQRVMDSMTSEISVTGADIISRGGSFDELMTTSRTWQTGLTEFLYQRREMLALLAGRPYTAELEDRLRAMLARTDIDRGGRWVDRKGVYEGSGLFITTPLMGTFLGTSRSGMMFLLSQFLCTDFPANHVDAEALLAVTRGQHEGVRFEVYESPMRNQASCSGCHAPMDSGAGFLVGLKAPLFGSIPTNKSVEGRLYVNGAGDLRGRGTGVAALMSLVTKQPEFPRCAVDRMFTYFVGRPPRATNHDEARVMDELVQTFERSGRRLDTLSLAILSSKPATEPVDLGAARGSREDQRAAAQADRRAPVVPRRTAELLQRHCVRCHDVRHALDLRTPPPAHDHETWAQIRSNVETGRMPPYDDARQKPQVMAPGERQELVSAAASLVAEAQQPPALRKQIDLTPRDWIYLVRDVARPLLSSDELAALIAKRSELPAAAKRFWIAHDVCTAIVDLEPTSRLDDSGVGELVRRWFERVYRAPPDASDIARGSAWFRRFEARAGSTRDAASALCTTYLTGPRARRVQIGAGAEAQR